MDKRFLQIFCFVILLFGLCYSAETDEVNLYDELKAYDSNALLIKTVEGFQNSLRLKSLKPLGNLLLQGFDESFQFIPSGDQTQNFSKCLLDLMYTAQNIKSDWGLKMIDSYGKPESGILKGNFRWVGDYDECIGIRAYNPNSTTIGNFRGKYCSLTWSLKALNLSKPLTFVTGICVPDSCSEENLQHDALQLLQMAGILPVLIDINSTLKFDALKCKPIERHFNTGAKAMIVLLSIFGALVVLGSSITVVEYLKEIMVQETKNTSDTSGIYMNNELNGDVNSTLDKHYDEAFPQDTVSETIRAPVLENLKTFLKCFCMFTNGGKLFNTSSSEGELLCLHGMRFLSMSWVILGHTYSSVLGQTKNLLEANTLSDGFAFQVILQGFYSVDSFFVLSGFLLMYIAMKEFSKTNGKISWPYFYIHRYIRLTPMYMILLGVFATVYRYMGSGPFWLDGDYDTDCSKVWWRNLLYINNFGLDEGQCMAWAWYLANDMQCFIISPLFLITLWKWPKVGYSLLAACLLISCLCNFFITYAYDLSNGFISMYNEGITNMDEFLQNFLGYYKKIYIMPYTRIGPYLVGMLTGYIFFKRKENNAPKHSLVFLTIGWIVASVVTIATVYGLYHAHPGLIARCFYNGLSRTCYGAGLCWVIYVCLIGQGGVVNSILSFKIFIPLSRLTYAAYLTHALAVGVYISSLRTSIDFSHPTLVVNFLGFMVMTYALSIPISLILESPIVGLEKLLRKKLTTKQKAEAIN